MGNTFVNQFRIHIIFLMVSIAIFNYILHIFPSYNISRVLTINVTTVNKNSFLTNRVLLIAKV